MDARGSRAGKGGSAGCELVWGCKGLAAGLVVEAFLATWAEVYAANPKRDIGLLLSIPGMGLKVLTPVVIEAAFLITRTAAFQRGRVGCAQGSLNRKLRTEAKLD